MVEDGLRPEAAEVESVEQIRLGTIEIRMNPPEPTGAVHPLAALWPMLGETELASLAADIKAKGLIDPLVIDPEGRLLEGRNRLAACRVAGVEPSYEVYSGDPRRFIWSKNAQRRNTTGGQRAMIAVVADWDIEQGKLRRSNAELAAEANVDTRRIVEAALIMEFQPALTQLVIDGEMPSSVAHRKAQSAQQDQDSHGAQFRNLKAERPDLAEYVSAGKMTLAEGQQEAEKQKRERVDRITQVSRQLAAILNHLDPMAIPIEAAARHWLDASETAVVPADDFGLARLRRAADVLNRLIELREEADETASLAEG